MAKMGTSRTCGKFFAVLLLITAGTGNAVAQSTNCAECWNGVTQWHGTWNLTLTGSSLNNSSQGTFDISNGVYSTTGSGSVSSSFPGCCTCSGSGPLDSSSAVEIIINPTNCTYTLNLSDRIKYAATFPPPVGTIQTIEACSGEGAVPIGTIPQAALPYFPLPDYGDSLVESGSYSVTAPAVGCYAGASATLTISWNIEPMVDTGPPKFTHIPVGGFLGCNPDDVDLPDISKVLDDTDGTAPSGQVSISADEVDVTNDCTVTMSFTLTATDECTDKEATALVVYSFTQDTDPPMVAGVPAGGDLGCNPTNPPVDASILVLLTVTDNCGVASTNVSHADMTNGCTVTRTFTITAGDDCGNVSSPATAIFTWTQDTTRPTITGVPAGTSLGCNPDNLPTDASVKALVQANDNCGVATKTVSHVDSTDGCTVTRTFTITVADNCGNVSLPSTVVYTWTADTAPPGFLLLPPGGYLGTNPPCLPDDGAIAAQSQATDNCGVSTVTASHADSGDTNLFTRTFTITATDFCGNSHSAIVLYTWSGTAGGAASAPILGIQELGNNFLLFWPTNADCFCLITRTGLTSGIWTAVTNTPAVSGNRFMVTNNAAGPLRLYRLAK